MDHGSSGGNHSSVDQGMDVLDTILYKLQMIVDIDVWLLCANEFIEWINE